MNTLSPVATGTVVTLEQMLAAREYRAARQAETLARFGKPLVSMTTVMPGPVKDGSLLRRVLDVAVEEVKALARTRKWPVISREIALRATGPEVLYVLDVEPWSLKLAAVELEDQHPLGRLWDLDVVVPGPRIISRKHLGLPARRCLVCECPAFECGRSQRHPLSELSNTVRQLVDEYDQHSLK